MYLLTHYFYAKKKVWLSPLGSIFLWDVVYVLDVNVNSFAVAKWIVKAIKKL